MCLSCLRPATRRKCSHPEAALPNLAKVWVPGRRQPGIPKRTGCALPALLPRFGFRAGDSNSAVTARQLPVIAMYYRLACIATSHPDES